ncbi:hypothetical protein EB151_05060 [archaeon]|nr:hypothetical protein [archaeon]
MKILVADRIVATSHDFPTVNCTIDPEDMRYISSLLRNNYSNTILATIRETYANAVDANKDNNLSPESIEIKCPTSFDPTYSVRDFGSGLSNDQIFNLYSKFGKSTKRGSDVSIGGFGIGRFAPLSYKDSFTVTSYHNGTKTIYSIYISEDNDTKIDQIFNESTSEKNGISISVAVSKNDVNKFNQEISNFFSNFEVLPNFLNIQTQIVKAEIVTAGKDWQIRKSVGGYTHYSVGDHGIIMGGIFYPINPELVDISNNSAYSWTKNLNKLVFIADIGSVSLHHSRESLEYNKTTKNYLKSRYKDFCEEFTQSIKDKVAQFDCLSHAMSYYAEIKNTFPRNAFDSLEAQDVFVYKDHKITASNFNRATYEDNGKHIRIPIYAKSYSKSGDRVVISKCYTISNNKNTYIVLNDLPDNTKVVPRVYDLVKKYENVIVISHDPAITSSSIVNGVDKFKELNRFDLVKTGFCNLSELTPVKLPSTRKTSSGSSYTPNYFYKIEGCSFHSSSSCAQEINDTSVTKLYFPVANNVPINRYAHFHQEKNRINSRIFSSALQVFNFNTYGVSNNVVQTPKFKNRTDFVDFCDFVKNKWDNCSDEIKSLIFEYLSYKTDQSYNLMTYKNMLEEVVGYKEFNDKLTICADKLIKADMIMFADFIEKWRNTFVTIGVEFAYNGETAISIYSKVLKQSVNEIYSNYPMLEIHTDLYLHDQKARESKFKNYISFINQQKGVDISKI